jgi:hypothetical protein
LKDRLELLHSENQQLRDLLEDKKWEIECLSLQVSEAADQNTSQESLAEAKLLKTTDNRKEAIGDARIEALIAEKTSWFTEIMDYSSHFYVIT